MAASLRAQLWALCCVALVPLSCGTSTAGDSRVALYLSEKHDVLNLKWDKGPANLEAQLVGLGLAVERAVVGQPADLAAGDAFIIPVQNGAAMYSSVEDMNAVAAFVSKGGLVVLLDSSIGKGETLKDFAAKALRYQGAWTVCKEFGNNARTSFGEPKLSTRASSFLPAEHTPWPVKLDDAKLTTVMTWAHHQDPNAVIEPLYSVVGDEMKTVAQSFGRVGTPGAVVWLGYSWKDGPKAAWGSLLNKLVTDFKSGQYKAPVRSMSYLHPLHVASTVESVAVAEAAVEHVVEAVAAVSEEANQVVRRALQQTGTYPSPPSPELVSLPPAPVGFEYVAQDVQLSFTATDVPPWCNPEDGSISTDAEVTTFLLVLEQEIADALSVTVDQVVILNVFCGPKEYPASQFGVKRRAALEEAAEVYTHRQLQVLFPSSKNVPHLMVIYPEEHVTAAAADLRRQRDAEVHSFFKAFDASAGRELDANRRRSLLQDDGAKLDLVILTLEEAPSPPPRPPNPPGVNDPPSPPPRPPRPPPNPPLTQLVAAATNASNAELGFDPPSPPPDALSSPPSPSPPILFFSPPPSPNPPEPTDAPRPPSPSPPSPNSSPSPSPSPSPAKPPIAITAPFTGMPAMGSVGNTDPLVFNTDENFASELKPLRALQLVDPNRGTCPLKPQKANNTPPPNKCQKCREAYKAWPVRNSGPKNATTVVLPLYFAEATQISKLRVVQLFNPSLIKVELLAWPLVLDNSGVPIWTVRGKPVYEVEEDTTPCRAELPIPLPDRTSGIKLRVKPGGSQQDLSRRLKKTAVSGVLLTFKKPKRARQAAFVGSVTFEGRVLYPTLDVYGKYKPKK